jgi:hypothetical protein
MKSKIQQILVCSLITFLYAGCHSAIVEPTMTPYPTKISTQYPIRTITPTSTITLTPTSTQTLVPQATFTPLPVLENRIPSGWQRHEYGVGGIGGQGDKEFRNIFFHHYNIDWKSRHLSGLSVADLYRIDDHLYTYEVIDANTSMDILIKEDNRQVYFRSCDKEKNNFWEYIIAFWSIGDHWVAETFCEGTSDIVLDGLSLNETYGYSESFAASTISGKIFYFFKRDGKIGFYFDGAEYMTVYEDVLYHFCCEISLYNPEYYTDQVQFYAIKSGKHDDSDGFEYKYAVVMGDLDGK